jgi:vacuolar protein-sorting-associated protein 4
MGEYMDRAEYIKKQVIEPENPSNHGNSAGGEATKKKDPTSKDNKVDEEDKKLDDALNQAIVREKPNVRWTDVAGLD